MPEKLTHYKVRVTSTDGGSEDGKVTVQTWDKKDRTTRAIKAWALCWVAAIVSVLIPLLHFVLVPSLIIAGPILAYVLFQQEEVLTGGRSRCPACSVDFSIARMRPQFPLHDICSHCQESVRIDKIE